MKPALWQNSPRTHSRGVALITALLVVAAATTATVMMTADQQIDIRRTGNLLDGDQAWHYALGAERWAAGLLRDDRRDGAIDHAGEDWGKVLAGLPVEGGVLSGQIEDLQGRLNLNNLIMDGKLSAPDLERLQRLLEQLGLDPDIALAAADWIDADLEPRFPGGAEDDYYLGLERPHRAANTPFAAVSELRLLRGVDSETYARLAPHVSALPVRTPVNVNTATLPVLRALADNLSEADAQALADQRGDDGYRDVAAFLARPELAGRGLKADGLTVGSDHFGVHARVQIGRGRADLYAILARASDGATQVVLRSRSGVE